MAERTTTGQLLRSAADSAAALLAAALRWAKAHKAASAGICAGALCILIAIVLACMAASGAARVKSSATALAGVYAQIEEHALSGEASALTQDLGNARIGGEELLAATRSAGWRLAGALPPFSNDARIVSELARANDGFFEGAVEPVISAYCALLECGALGADATPDVLTLAAHPDETRGFVDAVRSARPALESCNATLQQLDGARDPQLAEALTHLKEMLARARAGVDALDEALSAGEALNATITPLLPG